MVSWKLSSSTGLSQPPQASPPASLTNLLYNICYNISEQLSRRFLNTTWEGDSTTALGRPCQCLTILGEKKIFRIPSLNLPRCNLWPFPLVLSLVICKKRLTPSSSQPHFRKLESAMRSPLSLHFSRLNNPSFLSRSSSDLCSPYAESVLPVMLIGEWSPCPYRNP